MPFALAATPQMGIVRCERPGIGMICVRHKFATKDAISTRGLHCRTTQFEEHFMNLKLVAAISALAIIPAFAQAQQSKAPKPTKADVQKVVQLISGDKAKTTTYCDIAKLEDEMSQADEKKDAKKVEDLGKQVEDMSQKLGPEYAKLMAGLEEVDPESKDGKDLSTALEALDKLCPKK
jgi:hypothetical protein